MFLKRRSKGEPKAGAGKREGQGGQGGGAAQWLNLLRKRQLTLSVQGNTLRLLLLEGGRVLNWVTVPFNPALLRNGFIANQAGMAQVIKNALSSKGLPAGTVNAAFPAFQSLNRLISLPPVKDIIPQEALPREARRLMAFSPAEHYLFWQAVGTSTTEQRFLVLLVPRSPLVTFIETVRQAGLRPSHIELVPLCLLRLANQAGAIIANVESNSLDLTIAVDSVPVMTRSLFLEEEALTWESAPSRLAAELVRTIGFYNDTNPANSIPPELPIHLSGALSGEEVAAVVSRETGRPVMEFRPRVTLPNDFPLAAMAVNLGLAQGR